MKCSVPAIIAVILLATTAVTTHANHTIAEAELEPDSRLLLLGRGNRSAVAVGTEDQNEVEPIQLIAENENVKCNNTYNSSTEPSCPTWSYLTDNGSCECGDTLHGAIQCNVTSHYLAIHTCYCMTHDSSTSTTVVGPCLYSCSSPQVYHTLPLNVSQLNTEMCGHLHRTGQLCGQCEEGYKQPAYCYSPECVLCTSTTNHNRLKYIAVAFVPLTFFLMVVFYFRIRATSAQLNAFILFSQIVSAPPMVVAVLNSMKSWPKVVAQIGATVYGIWNLDFFRTVFPDICFDLSSLQILALDYVIAFYPLLLMIIFYVLIELHDSNCRPIVYLWKPFHSCFSYFRRQWNARASTIDAFTTCLLLSYVKLLNISGAVLVPTWVYDVQCQKTKLFLYYDTTIRYFNKEHLPYALVAIAVLLIFVFAPLLLLILYPMRCFQRCLSHCRVRWHALPIFADSFQGCYKDGTDGTRDCRYFAAMYLLVRIVMQIIFESLVNSLIVLFWEGTAIFLFAIVIAVSQPYKPKFAIFNTIDTVLSLLLSVWLMTSFAIVAINTTTSVNVFAKKVPLFGLAIVVGLLPLIYLVCIASCWLCCCTTLYDRCSPKTLKRSSSQNSLPDRMVNPDRYYNY